jgi:hypothetical protein
MQQTTITDLNAIPEDSHDEAQDDLGVFGKYAI